MVISDTLTTEDTGVWRDTTRIVRRADAVAFLADLKREGDGDILVFGSGTMWNGLLAAGMIDEIHLLVGAVVLGRGVPAFTTPPPGLRLIDVRAFAGSDSVLHRYAPAEKCQSLP